MSTSRIPYVSLHNHSDASSDGAGTVQSLVNEAKKLEMKALGLTDHGTLANSVAFATACYDANIIPILGMEAYLLYNGKRHHLTLLSLNKTGFNNLILLDSWSHRDSYIGSYPLLTLEKLSENRKGLYALSGCASSALYEGDEADAGRYMADLVSAMGEDAVALETMFVGSHDTWTRPLRLASKLKLPYVVTNDTHYPCRNQYPAHQAITEARKGYTYDSAHLWLKTGEEVQAEGEKHASTTTVWSGLIWSDHIADMVAPWDMRIPPSLPAIPDAEEILTDLLRGALKRDVALRGERDKRLARLRAEFKVLHERKFLDYIFILRDIVHWAKEQGIRVGPGRGSGGGSYVLYLLGITDIDPLQYDLMFERFLNPSRSDYPDVDVDFESDRRQEVMNYAHDRWGALPIATYSCYSHKSAVHDIARVLKIPKALELEAAEASSDSEKFRDFVAYHPDVAETYKTMLGQIRHRGKHAAGIIIPNQPVPIERAGDELVAAWAEGMNTKDLSKIGVVKYDLLGLTALSMLRYMEELTGEQPDDNPDQEDIYDLFCSGDTNGIFQWSGSEGIRELTKKIAPRNFYDLTTCNALYRPGALDAGTAEHYPEFMKAPRKLHPRIDPLLAKTYGVVCYQEQVMAVVAEVMGGDLSQADTVRRLISKAAVGDPKWEAEVGKLYDKFMFLGIEQAFPTLLLEQLWHEIYTHSRYSYNLAHATAYTLISYRMAWYKVHHRAAFTTAVLQYDSANSQAYILDAIQSGLEIDMPHVNVSGLNYRLVKGHSIALPLSDVAYLGEKGAAFLIEERETNGPFNSYEEFEARVPKRLCNNRARCMLERIGAFESLTGDPSTAIKDYSSLSIGSKYQNQLEILGYVVPSPILVEKMNALRDKPTKKDYYRFAAFVQKVTKKRSVHGPYTTYELSPEGSFWIREEEPRFQIGEFVSGTKSRFGHSNDAKRYHLVTEE